MSKYIHYFTAVTDFNTARSENYEEPWVSLTEESEIFDVDYNKVDSKNIPLTFEITNDGDIVWKTDNRTAMTIEYSKNGGEWTEITATEGDGTKIPVVNGDIVQFIGDNDTYFAPSKTGPSGGYFGGTDCGFKVKGNIMSLIDSENYTTMTSFPENSRGNFISMFQSCTGLTDASELILPATTLADNCYGGMFDGCTSLVNVPELPATTLASDCYNSMFYGCTSLTTAPVLPATTLAGSCYEVMFTNCTSLTQAPVLPATTLTEYCYRTMFSGCTSLNYIKCLATDISATECTSNWVSGVQTTSGTFIKEPSMNNWGRSVNGIPDNWTLQNSDGSPSEPAIA